jgi:hypothetical protein
MPIKTKTAAVVLAFILGAGSSLLAQQKGQYVPGQAGLNAGIIPDPGFAYGNMTLSTNPNILLGPPPRAVLLYSEAHGICVFQKSKHLSRDRQLGTARPYATWASPTSKRGLAGCTEGREAKLHA